jgi:hypothetical protein
LFLTCIFFLLCSKKKKKKKKETEFLLAAVLFTCGNGTVQNRVFGGIRYQSFVF